LSDCAIVADATGAEGRSNGSCSRRRPHAPDPKPTLVAARLDAGKPTIALAISTERRVARQVTLVIAS